MPGNAIRDSHGGNYCARRRGALTPEECREIEAHRTRERPTPWQALAARYGRCASDLKAMFEGVSA